MGMQRDQLSATTSNGYRKAIYTALGCQVILALFCTPIMDGGQSMQMWGFSMVAFYVGLIMIIIRRPKCPTKVDLFLIHWSFPFLFIFVAVPISIMIWKARGVWD